MCNFIVRVCTTGIFHPVSGDDEDRFSRAVLFACVLVYVSNVMDGTADRVQQGGATANLILPLLA